MSHNRYISGLGRLWEWDYQFCCETTPNCEYHESLISVFCSRTVLLPPSVSLSSGTAPWVVICWLCANIIQNYFKYWLKKRKRKVKHLHSYWFSFGFPIFSAIPLLRKLNISMDLRISIVLRRHVNRGVIIVKFILSHWNIQLSVTLPLIPSVLLSRSFPSRFEMTAMVKYPLLSSRELELISDSRIWVQQVQSKLGSTVIQFNYFTLKIKLPISDIFDVLFLKNCKYSEVSTMNLSWDDLGQNMFWISHLNELRWKHWHWMGSYSSGVKWSLDKGHFISDRNHHFLPSRE